MADPEFCPLGQVRFDPEDHLAHPLFGHRVKTSNLLLKCHRAPLGPTETLATCTVVALVSKLLQQVLTLPPPSLPVMPG